MRRIERKRPRRHVGSSQGDRGRITPLALTAAGIVVACILVAVAIAGHEGGAPPAKPSAVVIVVIDTLRADFVGEYGADWPATPAIDAIAREGVLFEQAFAQASWTRPSVPTILTGLYPSEHHLTGFDEPGGDGATRGERLADEAETVAESLQRSGWRTGLAGFQFQLSPRFGLDQGFDFYRNNIKGGARAIVQEFLGWVDEAPRRPFFGYLHFLDLHWPYCPPSRLFGTFDPTPTAMNVCHGHKALKVALQEREIVPSAAERRALRARYAETLLAIDGEIAGLRAELERRGVWDEMLLVITADHGQELGEHGGYDHGTSLYDELLHVPMVWKLPRSWNLAGGRRVVPPVELRSVAATALDAAGVRPRSGGGHGAASLLPWLTGEAGTSSPVEYVAAESNGLYAVRDRRYKLVVDPARGSTRLFDLRDDPLELFDVAADEPVALDAMRGHFREWRAQLRPLARSAGSAVALDEETANGLRALGYIN